MLALLLHHLIGALACGEDTSYCASSTAKNGLYQGILRDRGGEPVADKPFTVSFESRSQAGLRRVGGFTTGPDGRYCIVWPEEAITPYIYVVGQLAADVPSWRPLDGAAPPRGCQPGDAGIPWDRADGLFDTVQYRSVEVLGVLSGGLLLLGLVMDGRLAQPMRLAGLIFTVLTAVSGVIVWGLL